MRGRERGGVRERKWEREREIISLFHSLILSVSPEQWRVVPALQADLMLVNGFSSMVKGCVCMCVYICVHAHVCLCACVSVCVRTRVCVWRSVLLFAEGDKRLSTTDTFPVNYKETRGIFSVYLYDPKQLFRYAGRDCNTEQSRTCSETGVFQNYFLFMISFFYHPPRLDSASCLSLEVRVQILGPVPELFCSRVGEQANKHKKTQLFMLHTFM